MSSINYWILLLGPFESAQDARPWSTGCFPLWQSSAVGKLVKLTPVCVRCRRVKPLTILGTKSSSHHVNWRIGPQAKRLQSLLAASSISSLVANLKRTRPRNCCVFGHAARRHYLQDSIVWMWCPSWWIESSKYIKFTHGPTSLYHWYAMICYIMKYHTMNTHTITWMILT